MQFFSTNSYLLLLILRLISWHYNRLLYFNKEKGKGGTHSLHFEWNFTTLCFVLNNRYVSFCANIADTEDKDLASGFC